METETNATLCELCKREECKWTYSEFDNMKLCNICAWRELETMNDEVFCRICEDCKKNEDARWFVNYKGMHRCEKCFYNACNADNCHQKAAKQPGSSAYNSIAAIFLMLFVSGIFFYVIQ